MGRRRFKLVRRDSLLLNRLQDRVEELEQRLHDTEKEVEDLQLHTDRNDSDW